MKTHIFTATCSVCGEEGAATPRTAAAAWYADTVITHTNPRICADNIRYKEQAKLREKEKQLRQAKLSEPFRVQTAIEETRDTFHHTDYPPKFWSDYLALLDRNICAYLTMEVSVLR